MRLSRGGAAVLAVALCAGPWTLRPCARAAAEDAPGIDLPMTIGKVWYRTGGKRREGDLTVTAGGLEFIARKKVFSIPLDRVQFISYGPMKGDVDTDWVLLTVGVAPPYDVIGFRDGTKWGFGGRTDEIYVRLRRALAQLGAAQYRVPPGYQVYEDPDRSCALAIPESWNSYVESLVVIAGRSPWGTTIVSERPIRTVGEGSDGAVEAVDDLELLDAILAGESPGFFIERDRAVRGMRCRGFSDRARDRLLQRAREDAVFDEPHEVLQAPAVSETTIGGCQALRLTGRSRREDGAEVVLELVAVTSGETLFVFGLRALADRYEAFREPFATALSSVKFPRLPAALDPPRYSN